MLSRLTFKTVGLKPASITKNLHLWSKGLLMGAGAKVLLACRGIFSDDDWTVLQTVGVNCFDKDTAIY